MRAGLPVRASVDRLKQRVKGGELDLLAQKLGAGDRLGEAFEAARFLPFESHLVVAGERSGQLESIFEHLSQFWKRELEFRQALVRPLLYPIVILHLAIILGTGIELVTTAWPVVAVHFVARLVAFYILAALLYFLARLSWSSPALKSFWLRVPIVGRALKTTFAYRWITTLRLEFGAGISLYRAVGDAWRASGSVDCNRLALEAEEAMRGGASLSALAAGWRQLPRDWIDFIETGELSGGFDAAFKNLEAEAARDWTLAQQRLSEWLPKIVYFFALLIVAAQVASVMYQVEVAPIVDAEKQIDDATR